MSLNQSPYSRIERVGIVLLGILMLSVAWWRAAHLSATYDEVWVETISQDSVWNIMFHERHFTSANNHILNTLLAKLCLSLGEPSLLLARLPNVFSILVYIMGIALLAKQITSNPVLRWSVLLISCSMPFVLDFFSLTRGYGLAIGFQAMSMGYAYTYLHSNNRWHQFYAYLFAFLAVWSNFTWLNYFLALWLSLILVRIPFPWQGLPRFSSIVKQESIPLCFIAGMVLLFSKPILLLRGNDEFKWGSNAWIDSFHKLAANLNYHTTFGWSVFTQVVLIALSLYFVFLLLRKMKTSDTGKWQVYLVSLYIVGFFILISVLQRFLLQSMYPDGRKALMYYLFIPVFIVSVLSLYDWKSTNTIRLVSMGITLMFVLHGVLTIDVLAVKEWASDKYNAEVVRLIADTKGKGIKVSWELGSSMDYYARKNKHLAPVKTIDENTPEAMYYYLSDRDTPKLPGRSMFIKYFENGYTLWRKD
jgi:hypothetical protein